MIWNKDFLFIHVPKTAGMSMTSMLLRGLKGHVYYTGPHERKKVGNVVSIPGKRHETLADAESTLTYMNQSISSFKKIFSVMRSPYDLEVSRYSYLRRGLSVDKGPAQEIAMSSTFKEYLEKAPFFGQFPPRLDRYYQLGCAIPDNLIILKFENLASEIRFKLAPHLDHVELGHENISDRRPYVDMYDYESELLCYERHAWFFDKGFYARMPFK
jgi:hypothetical protein